MAVDLPQSLSKWRLQTNSETTGFDSRSPHGNVKALLQDLPEVGPKRTEYVYDLVSGNVNQVHYQKGYPDQLIHRYRYDADNRLEEVQTSTDGLVWNRDAAYYYYPHGPLARVELGEYNVQGMDYYYTLQGWLKGINLPMEGDPGGDGVGGFRTGTDAFSFALGYYEGDYKPINPSVTISDSRDDLWSGYQDIRNTTEAKGLYNGNISWMSTDLPSLGESNRMQAMVYGYDQLHRIVQAKSLSYGTSSYDGWTAGAHKYDADYSYDPNGNLLSLQRRDESTSLQDDLTYEYYDFSNKLKNVDGTETENYTYDQIGSLISDNAEGIDSIAWTPYGKVRAVFKDDSSQVHFRYDAAGNRIAKITESDTTIYVRDASGNVMATYKNDTLTEQSIYGSSRLGLINYASKTAYRSLGGKKYELSNHLGNVLAVVSDNIHLDQDSTWTSLINTTDYYPFGLAMDGRSVQDSTYRYGFNGKEEDSNGEWGGQSHYDYGFRIYNPSIAKFLSVDPLTSSYPWYTPYQFAGNKPIWAIDLDGLEELIYTDNFKKSQIGQSVIEIASETTLQKEFYKALKSQNKYDVYVGTFNSSITDYEGNVQSLKINSNGHPVSIGAAKGFMFEVKNLEFFNKLRKTSFAFNSIKGIENEKITDGFKKGKGFLFVIIADQMMNPSNNTKSTKKSSDFLNNAIRNAANTNVHESWSHGIPYLKNASYQSDYTEEHKNYHGKKTKGSPSVEEYDKNPNAYEKTNFGKTMKEIDKNIEK